LALFFALDSKCKGLLLDSSTFGNDESTLVMEDVESVLASPEDMEQVKRNPLLRARACIENALQYESKLNNIQLISSRLGLCYIYLSFGYYQHALDMCQIIFKIPKPTTDDTTTITSRLYRRQIATTRLYAAEASCALGQPKSALIFLSSDNDNENGTVNELALSLSGMSIESITINEKAKRQFDKAQMIVQSLTIALTSDDNNNSSNVLHGQQVTTTAKQLANKVRLEDDWNTMDNDKSSACLALVYSMLRAGEQSSALALLMSMRSL
jgi:hypothetical protein